MKWIKYFAIPIIVIIIIIISLLIIANINKKKYYDRLPKNIEISKDGSKIKAEELDSMMYYTIMECCDNLIEYAQKENKEAVYALLSSNYKTSKTVNLSNVFEITNLNKIKQYKTLKIYRASIAQYARYFIQGITENGYIYFNLNVNIAKSTFDIEIINEDTYRQYIQNELSIYKQNIEKNSFNTLPSTRYSEIKIAEIYFLDYIENAVLYPQIAYNSLDKEFRELKFKSIQDYIEYVSKNEQLKNIYINNIQNTESLNDVKKKIGLKNYTDEEKDGYIEYVFEDTYGNTYTYKVTTEMQYTLTFSDKNTNNVVR